MYYMGCVKITSLATLLSMRLCLQVVLRHVGDIAASRALQRSFLTERTMSSQRPSRILSTLDGHEARQAPFRGRLGFRTQAVTKARRGGRKCSSPNCRHLKKGYSG